MTRNHFGLTVSRLANTTYIQTVNASADCRFRCAACHEPCWAVWRRSGDRAWHCPRCAGANARGESPGPRLFVTQPARSLVVGERLRSPAGVWVVGGHTGMRVIEHGYPNVRSRYVLECEDGRRQEFWARDMEVFHLVPPSEQQSFLPTPNDHA